jgi:hypothetical protein
MEGDGAQQNGSLHGVSCGCAHKVYVAGCVALLAATIRRIRVTTAERMDPAVDLESLWSIRETDRTVFTRSLTLPIWA